MLWITSSSVKDYEFGNVEIGQIYNGQGSMCPNIRHFAFYVKRKALNFVLPFFK